MTIRRFRTRFRFLSAAVVLILLPVLPGCKSEPQGGTTGAPAAAGEVRPGAKLDYAALLGLWREFREYQKPKVTAGVPDYTAAAMSAQKARIKEFQDRLAAFDASGWPVADWGSVTVLADDPALNVREAETSRQPLKVVVDANLSMPLDSKMLSGAPLLPLVYFGSEAFHHNIRRL